MDYSINDTDKNVELNNLEDIKTNSQLDGIIENELKSRLNCFKKILLLLSILVIISIVFLVIFISKNNEKEKVLNEKDEELKKKLNEKDEELKKILKEKDEKLKEILNQKDEEIKREKYNKEILIKEDINYNNDDIVLNYTINESAKYRICLYGPKAEKGGRGCVQCAERYFENGSIIEYQLGGKTSGGEGGKIYFGKEFRSGYNGAGLSNATFSDDFYIVAGGGGGDSETGNKGGDCEQDGEGTNGGEGAIIVTGEGGNGGYLSDRAKHCGGGGGNGFFGGGAGNFGDLKSAGGGGGGSSYCNETKGVICFNTSINIFEYSKLEIYKRVFEE